MPCSAISRIESHWYGTSVSGNSMICWFGRSRSMRIAQTQQFMEALRADEPKRQHIGQRFHVGVVAQQLVGRRIVAADAQQVVAQELHCLFELLTCVDMQTAVEGLWIQCQIQRHLIVRIGVRHYDAEVVVGIELGGHHLLELLVHLAMSSVGAACACGSLLLGDAPSSAFLACEEPDGVSKLSISSRFARM